MVILLFLVLVLVCRTVAALLLSSVPYMAEVALPVMGQTQNEQIASRSKRPFKICWP